MPHIIRDVGVRRSPLEEQLLPRLRQRREAHGRDLASDLGASPGAIARALDRMEKRGLVASRWVGRTRLYRPAVEDRRLIEDARRRIMAVDGVPVLAVLPFGSRARGEGREGSDLDLVVVVADDAATRPIWQLLRQSLRDLKVPVDLLLYSATEARRWARVPGNPMSAALAANGVQSLHQIAR